MGDEEIIRGIVKKYQINIKDDYIYFYPDIPYKKLKNVQNSYAKGISIREVLILIDNTTFGSAKDGALFTDKAIYVHNMMSKIQKYSYQDIRSVVFLPGMTSNLMINGVKFLETNFPSHTSMTMIAQMIEKIIKALNKPVVDEKTPVESLKELKELYEQGIINEQEYEKKRQKYVELL